MRRACFALLMLAACAPARVQEPASEDRLMRALSEAPGDIPEPLAVGFDAVASPVDVELEPPLRYWRSRTVGGAFVYPVVTPLVPLPPVRSRALTHPQGVQGGSTPGLLP